MNLAGIRLNWHLTTLRANTNIFNTQSTHIKPHNPSMTILSINRRLLFPHQKAISLFSYITPK